ncbi:hypothetical protein NSK_002185 [Nannochloropsis salina CCMP1776]|uniref:DUF202 domain-containing protein n=1 Tax=Nannochloropsis salina CCMP1776 TaxID=1027361 RepID=A0A4D9DCY6_9STRA|nr:hypothetical protein NSK_002185 [Nannochloropsis salina CCMP1776]|eukprot:TFJ86528.1 hypothetical protein NSK_002185 [Nannochloropsis salina CCMP1776]
MPTRNGTQEEKQPLRSGTEIRPIYSIPNSGDLGSGSDAHRNGDRPLITTSTPAPHAHSLFGNWWPFSKGRFSGDHDSLGSPSASGARKVRKAPVKVEPKVFFANERTFLAWLNMSVTLSSISVAILAFADHNEFSQVYGFIILPVAICFCVYAMRTYMKRSSMLRNRMPGPYEDRLGPIVLTVLLVLTILINTLLKIIDIYTPSGSGGGREGGRVPINGGFEG